MIGTNDLLVLFQEKLAQTGSLDKAFLKAAWVAYKTGLEDGEKAVTQPDHKPAWQGEPRD